MEIVDEIEAQQEALMHLSATCEESGLAMCIENVCHQLEGTKDKSRELYGEIERLNEWHRRDINKYLGKIRPTKSIKEKRCKR